MAFNSSDCFTETTATCCVVCSTHNVIVRRMKQKQRLATCASSFGVDPYLLFSVSLRGMRPMRYVSEANIGFNLISMLSRSDAVCR